MAKAKKTKNAGVITQIIGAVLDIRFQDGDLPEIYDAIHIPTKDGNTLVVEVSQHLGDDTVRCIAMGPMDWCEAWKRLRQEPRFRCRSAKRHWDVCSMYSEIRSMKKNHRK